MPWYWLGGKPLFVGGQVAVSDQCCCICMCPGLDMMVTISGLGPNSTGCTQSGDVSMLNGTYLLPYIGANQLAQGPACIYEYALSPEEFECLFCSVVSNYCNVTVLQGTLYGSYLNPGPVFTQHLDVRFGGAPCDSPTGWYRDWMLGSMSCSEFQVPQTLDQYSYYTLAGPFICDQPAATVKAWLVP